MPIPSPILDDRSYQQLRDELVRRIPVYTPEWTDHNASDPGITLIELFSFLGENLLFRFNQIPDSTRLEFLRLLQIPLRPAVAARALASFTTDKLVKGSDGKWTGQLVPMHSEAKAGAFPFELLNEVVAWPISFVAIGRVSTPTPDPKTEPDVAQNTAAAVDAAELGIDESAIYYESKTVDINEPPVDFDATVDRMLWIGVLDELKKSPDPSVIDRREFFKDALLNVGFIPEPILDSIDQVQPCPGVDFQPTAPAVEWQVSTGEIVDGKPTYRRLQVEGDTTRGLSQEGVLRLRLPKQATDFGQFKPDDLDQLGTGEFPPSLDDEKENKVLCWLRGFRHNGSGFGKVIFVGANVAEVVQSKKARTEFLGTGNAQPDQRYKLINKSVLANTLVLEVEEGQRWNTWKEVEGFYASQPDDRHFVIDLEAGEVRFGNGLQGLPPQIGQRIRAREYRFGGGAEGNVAANGISKLVEFPDLKVANPLPAHGGAAAESIRDGITRIPGELRRRDRAVTATDFQELALATPGADVGRAECLPRFHPQFRSPSPPPEKAGVVSVVVWPSKDPKNPNAPTPDRTLLRAVCEWLDYRRLVTTELYVIPPTYRKVAVAVGLEAKPGYGIEAVRHWVELVIRQYLAPLPPYGPEGQGWPLGRRVHGPELEAAALQVEGVEFLNDLKVGGWDGTQWLPGPVVLEKYEVPELVEISVMEGPLGQFEAWDSVTPSPLPDKVKPIPVIREEC